VPTNRPVDPTALALPDEVRVERRYEPPGYQPPRGRPSDGTIARPVKAAASRKRLLPRVLDFPVGPDLLLLPHVRRQALRLAREEKVAAVFASSSPYAVLMMGAQTAERAGLPLCLDLRDPWTLNFMMKDRASWARAWEQKIERGLFEQADRVLLNTQTCLDAYRELYADLPPERMEVLRNAFDPADRPATPPAPSDDSPITLLHFGNCYGPRRLETFLRAMRKVRDRSPDAPRVVLENLGRLGEADIGLARELGLADDLRHGTFVPFHEGLERIAAADLALLIAYGDETLYIPAKLYDYLVTRAPIACVSREGELASIVESTGAGTRVEPGDVEAAANLIDRAIAARARGERAFVPDEEALEAYSARSAARRLAGVLDAIARPVE
jgi:glycosyltransferase involved in cell wall biosynthesis